LTDFFAPGDARGELGLQLGVALAHVVQPVHPHQHGPGALLHHEDKLLARGVEQHVEQADLAVNFGQQGPHALEDFVAPFFA